MSARTARGALAPGDPEAAARHVLESGLFRPGRVVSGYIAVGDEIDPALLMTELAVAGAALCLPAVAGRGKPLIFRGWAPGAALVDVHYGLKEPEPHAPVLEPDVLIVPLLAFDRRGGRLGYGGGFYDRTLSALRQQKTVVAIGLAYAGQEIAEAPMAPEDEWLDWVATDAELIGCR